MTTDADIWVLVDDRAGNRAQALGVAERLGQPFRTVEIRYALPARLPNMLLGASLAGLDTASKASLTQPWPKLVIAAGRRSAPVARWIRKQSAGQTRLVQIMDPGSGHADFDLICRPAHDSGSSLADNVMSITAAPHRMSETALQAARTAWQEAVKDLPAPRIALLIGGATRRRSFSDDMARALCAAASKACAALGGSLMVTTSRRTGAVVDTIETSLTGAYQLFRWDRGGDNPYAGYLALADAVIVTGESVSMCSEAVASGKPVYIYAPSALVTPKHARLHSNLVAGGHARMFDGKLDLDWQPVPLDAAQQIADAIVERNLWGDV